MRAAESLFAQIKGWMEREAAARSARTRRSTRSSRGRSAENVVQGFRRSLDGNKRNERVVCRVDSVKHSTSPSRRESIRRAITSQVFQSQSAATEHPLARSPRRRVSQSAVFNTFTNSAFPIVASSVGILFPLPYFPCPERAEPRAPRREI